MTTGRINQIAGPVGYQPRAGGRGGLSVVGITGSHLSLSPLISLPECDRTALQFQSAAISFPHGCPLPQAGRTSKRIWLWRHHPEPHTDTPARAPANHHRVKNHWVYYRVTAWVFLVSLTLPPACSRSRPTMLAFRDTLLYVCPGQPGAGVGKG